MLLIPLSQKLFQSIGTLHAGKQVILNEVGIAPVAFGPFAFFCERARQRPLIKRNPGNHCQAVRRPEPQNVTDLLDRWPIVRSVQVGETFELGRD